MADLVHLKALTAFTVFVQGFGQVHGDPDNKDARIVKVPEHALHLFEGKVEPVEPKASTTRKATPGVEDYEGYELKRIPIGRYEVSGPGITEPVTIKGKAEAKAYVDGIIEGGPKEGGPGSSDDAPTE
jgi:hypothetical protein